ncbi:hypothetical protein TRVL_09907 [Trypanosoma vivax]|nr:hypothetical protein TRVL_09907 [Trypanosoma vivax]
MHTVRIVFQHRASKAANGGSGRKRYPHVSTAPTLSKIRLPRATSRTTSASRAFFHLRPPSNQPLGHVDRCALDDWRSQIGAFVIRPPFSSSTLPPLTRRSAFFTALPLTTTRSLSTTAVVHPSPADGGSPEKAPKTDGEEVLHKTPSQPPACLANTKKMLPALFLSASPALSACVLP